MRRVYVSVLFFFFFLFGSDVKTHFGIVDFQDLGEEGRVEIHPQYTLKCVSIRIQGSVG